MQPAAIAMPVCALTPPYPTAGRTVTPACAAPVARLGSRYEVGSSGAAPRRGLSGAKYQDCAARAMLAANTAAEGMRERVSARSANATAEASAAIPSTRAPRSIRTAPTVVEAMVFPLVRKTIG